MRRNRKVTVAALLLGLAPAALGAATPRPLRDLYCRYPSDPELRVGWDHGGYFVKLVPQAPRGGQPKGYLSRVVNYRAAGDYLARAAGATVVYTENASATERPVPAGEFRASDPLAAFQAFATAAGLEVETSTPGLWFVNTTGWSRPSAITVFARPIDPEKQGFRSDEDTRAIELALVQQLPVREACLGELPCSMGVSYYWLPEEGRDVMFVLASNSGPRLSTQPPRYGAYKVRLDQSGDAVRVECLWASTAEGPLVPDLAEDFDGDGVRDLVFENHAVDYAVNMIRSGRDGRELLRFLGNQIVVLAAGPGLKPIAVDNLAPPSAEDLDDPACCRGPAVLAFSEAEQSFRPVEAAAGALKTQEATRPGGSRVEATWAALAAHVVRPAKLRAYVITRMPSTVIQGDVEVVGVRRLQWDEEITREMVSKGYPAHILFEHSFSPPSTAGAPLPQSP